MMGSKPTGKILPEPDGSQSRRVRSIPITTDRTVFSPSQPGPDRPVILVVSGTAESAEELAHAVERAGGVPRITSLSLLDALRDARGVVVGGPAGDGVHADAVRVIAAAREAGRPVLCTGSGMHALNASAGGSTVDLEGHGPLDDGEEAASSYHRIYIAPGSRLAATVGSGGFVRVNSRHLRGLREAHRSPDLMASAYSLEDGVIEALESPDGPWTIGVQFHPERRAELPPHFGRLFEALVERSRHPRDREK